MPFAYWLRSTICFCFVLIFKQFSQAQTVSIDSIITSEKLKEVVYEIADDSLQGRYTNSGGCIKAASIIARRMQEAGIKKVKGMDGYFHGMDSKFKNVVNVIGALQGKSKPDEIIIISAHYDHLGTAGDVNKIFEKTDIIFNGANDDVSGIAAMLSLAAYFSTIPIERTILFVAFSGEEIGFLGSNGLKAVLMPEKIVAQINLEMLGRQGVYRRPFITGHWYSNLRSLLNQTLKDSIGIKNYFGTDASDGHNLFRRSDNFPFAMMGIPAHTIMLSTDADEFYHTVKDEPKTLDYNAMCTITKNIALSIVPLVQGEATPDRINPHVIQGGLLPFSSKGNLFQKRAN